MELGPDDLAGVVDLFDALSPTALEQALEELAFKRGVDAPDADHLRERAVASYHLLEVDRDGETLLVVGPTAFPALPEGAEDLPHIMDGAGGSVPEADRVEAARERFRADAASAIEAGDAERIHDLLDVSYELETWGDLDLGAVRDRLDDALE